LSEEFPEKQLVQEFAVIIEIFFNTANEYIQDPENFEYGKTLDDAAGLTGLAAYLLFGTSGYYIQSNGSLKDNLTTE
jgi:hypothetical protein